MQKNNWKLTIIPPRIASDTLSVIASCPHCGSHNAIAHGNAMGFSKEGHPIIWSGFFTNYFGHEKQAEEFALQNAAAVDKFRFCPECGKKMGEEKIPDFHFYVGNDTTPPPEIVDCTIYAVKDSCVIAGKPKPFVQPGVIIGANGQFLFHPCKKNGKVGSESDWLWSYKFFVSEEAAHAYVLALRRKTLDKMEEEWAADNRKFLENKKEGEIA